mmetsp:Transcript_31548/g.32761  ORF Transcript_31548/g.32761 Transcript_31548/m.32761 type:complete len:910 (-) Transcript_31548:87-2816(-)
MMVNLASDPERTFIYVEQAFFTMWYPSQSTETKETLKKWLHEGRFEFILGGYVMQDEADTTFQHIIDQMRLGLQFLWTEFQYRPTIGWFIDPFGHAAANAYLLKEMGFDKIVYVRIDPKEKKQRIAEQTLQFNWTIYKDLGEFNKNIPEAPSKDTIFTHIAYKHYSPWIFEEIANDELVNWDEATLSSKTQEMVDYTKKVAQSFHHDHVLFFFGNDFKFTAPEANFKNMEILMSKINSDPSHGIKLVYSTPTRYFKAVFDAMEETGKSFPVKENGDFFPYAEDEYAYWSGYFTSRPNLKVKVREAGIALEAASYLLAENMLQSNISKEPIQGFSYYMETLFNLREKLAISQHHDAIAGTSSDYVSFDYEYTLEESRNKVNRSLSKMILDNVDKAKQESDLKNEWDISACVEGYSNSDCEEIFASFDKEGFAPIDIFNNRVNNGNFVLKLHLPSSKIDLYDESKSQPVPNDIVCQPNYDHSLRFGCQMFFAVNFNRKESFQRFYLKKITEERELPFEKRDFQDSNLYDINQIKFKIGHSAYYSYYGEEAQTKPAGEHNDGPYNFSTTTYYPTELDILSAYKSKEGKVLEFQHSFQYDFSYLHVRKYKGIDFLEVESILNPAKRMNGINNILHIQSDLKNNITLKDGSSQPEFWTDSNGLKMMRRIKDFRRDWDYTVTEPVAANFYPVNFAVSIRDRKSYEKKHEINDYSTMSVEDRVLTVFNDRSQASGAMREGEIMMNIQRLTIKDDYHGARVPLYETSSNTRYFKIYHYISLNNRNNQNTVYDYINFRPIYFNNKSNITLSKESLLGKILNTDCLVNIQVLTERKFFIQLFNRNDPYYSLLRETCEYSFSQLTGLDYSVQETEKHGADYGQLKEEHNTEQVKYRRELEFFDSSESIEPQGFKLFLIIL